MWGQVSGFLKDGAIKHRAANWEQKSAGVGRQPKEKIHIL